MDALILNTISLTELCELHIRIYDLAKSIMQQQFG